MKTIVKTIGEDYFISSLPFLSTPKLFKNGDILPNFRISVEMGLWQNLPKSIEAHSFFYIYELLEKGPLLISTHSPAWKSYAEQHLHNLSILYKNLLKEGGNLLLLSTEYFKNIIHIAVNYNVPFNIVQDYNNQVSELLGAYSEYEPVWDRIAGISEDVPFPAMFIVGRNRRIVYHHIDKNFSGFTPHQEIVTAIKIASQLQD